MQQIRSAIAEQRFSAFVEEFYRLRASPKKPDDS